MRTTPESVIRKAPYSGNRINQYLNEEFRRRKSTNKKYSIRAFALFLQVDQSLLTKVLKGERTFSRGLIESTLTRLKASPEIFRQCLASKKGKKTYREIDEKVFEVISDWKYMAILESFVLKDFVVNTTNVCRRFGFREEETELIFQTLIDHKMIERQTDNSYISVRPDNSWVNDYSTTPSRRTLQKKILEKSMTALEEISFDLRDHGSTTLALNKSQLPEIKKLLTTFRRDLVELIQKKEPFDEVYQLSISLFPLTKVSQ